MNTPTWINLSSSLRKVFITKFSRFITIDMQQNVFCTAPNHTSSIFTPD